MNTFSDMIMRSHPSCIPDDQFQIYDSVEAIQFFSRMVKVHVSLADYKMKLMQEASESGSPATRSMMMHFPHDARARQDST